MYDETNPLISQSSQQSSSATSSLYNFLYGTGAVAMATTTTYLNSMYYKATTQHILTQQIPGINNLAMRMLINTLGATGVSIRSLSQITEMVSKMRSLVQQPKQSLPMAMTLMSALCAGIGAYLLTDIQAKEYEFDYDPALLAIAIPVALGGMEAVEALLGSLELENIKKLLSFLLKKNQQHVAINIEENSSAFPTYALTCTVTMTSSLLILYSFTTIIDELRRNVLLSENGDISVSNSLQFIVGILGNVLQTLLDLEKLSECMQKMHKKEMSLALGVLSFTLATAASSLNFIMGYEFGHETCKIENNTNIALGVFAALPKITSTSMFIYPALNYAQKAASEGVQRLKSFRQ